MSFEAYPYLYLCSVSEMLYIIDHRLVAQKIDKFKSQKGELVNLYGRWLNSFRKSRLLVLKDVISRAFSYQAVEQVFLTKDLISLEQFREIIWEIAHCSIMKLSEDSMNKVSKWIWLIDPYIKIFLTSFLISSSWPLNTSWFLPKIQWPCWTFWPITWTRCLWWQRTRF